MLQLVFVFWGVFLPASYLQSITDPDCQPGSGNPSVKKVDLTLLQIIQGEQINGPERQIQSSYCDFKTMLFRFLLLLWFMQWITYIFCQIQEVVTECHSLWLGPGVGTRIYSTCIHFTVYFFVIRINTTVLSFHKLSLIKSLKPIQIFSTHLFSPALYLNINII